MRRDDFATTSDFAPPMGWSHQTATGELLASAPPHPPKAERRRAERAAHPDGADCIRITGELVQDACVRYQASALVGANPSGRAWLQVRLMVPGGQFVMAAQELGTTTADHVAAERRCRYLRRGMRATIYGKGLLVVPLQSEQVVQVLLPSIFVESAPVPSEVRS